MKVFPSVVSFLLLLPSILLAGGPEADRVEAFLQASKRLPVAERIARARETIQTSHDQAVVAEAVWDLAKFSVTPERAQVALASVEALIAESQEGSKVFRQANLARARLLARLGQKGDADGIFRRAIAEHWDKNAYKYFYESLWETGEYALLAIDEYDRHTSDEYSDEDRAFYESERDFVDMFGRLRAMKVASSQSSAMEEVFPRLKESKRRPLAKSIAKALCLAADDRYEEAIALLNQLENLLGSGDAPASDYDESKDLPLYLAAVLFFEGRDFDAARAAFREYMDRNEDTRTRVLERALKLTYAMEHSTQDQRKIVELTGFLVSSEFVMDEEIRSQLPEGNVASLLTMHQLGLACRGEWDESAQVCLQIMEKYYPQTLAGANAAMSLAVNLSWRYGDMEGPERLLNDIVSQAPYDGIVPHVERLLAKLALERSDYDTALFLLEDVLDRIGPFGKGPLLRCRQKALALREEIMNRTSPRHR